MRWSILIPFALFSTAVESHAYECPGRYESIPMKLHTVQSLSNASTQRQNTEAQMWSDEGYLNSRPQFTISRDNHDVGLVLEEVD